MSSATIDRLAYSVQESADLLSVSDDTIRRMIADGDLAARKARGRVVIPRAALESFLYGEDEKQSKQHQPASITREVQGALRRGKL